jgi:predicted O-methyltransferase YrrM
LYTYPAIAYLSQLDFSERTVFEYGAGNSTLWWGARSKRVVSVESGHVWASKVSRQAEALTIEILEAADKDEYVSALDGVFDVIVVDGWPGACAERAVTALAPGGLIVLDNADWYPGTCAMLRATELIQVDFSGFGPVNPYTWTTSLFLHRDFRARPVGERPTRA